MKGNRGRLDVEDGPMAFTMEELREFLEGDLLEGQADPEFKEQLRQQLWEMLRARRAGDRVIKVD